MEHEELLTISQVAAQSGLSVYMLRRYDAADVLRPARVDEFTRYRWYERRQVSTAQLIRYLRSVDMSLDDIRQIVQGRANAIDLIHQHRQRLAEQRRELRTRIRRSKRLTRDVNGVISAGELDVDAIHILTPQHYLLEDEVWLETTGMSIAKAMEAEELLCSLYDIGGLEFTYEDELGSEWTILKPRDLATYRAAHWQQSPTG